MNVLLMDDFYFSEDIVFSTPDLRINPIALFPNPSNGRTTLSNLNEGDLVTLIDATGKVLSNEVSTGDDLNLEFSAPGIYFISVRNEHSIETRRLVVNK